MPCIPSLVTNPDGSMQLTLKEGRVSVNCLLKPGSDYVAAMKAAQVALDLAVEQHKAQKLTRDSLREAAEEASSTSDSGSVSAAGSDTEGEGESIETTDDEEDSDSDTASSSLAEFLTEHPEDTVAEEMIKAVQALEGEEGTAGLPAGGAPPPEDDESVLMSDECYSSDPESESSYEEPPRLKPAARASALKAAPVQSLHAKLLNVRVPAAKKKASRLRKLGPKADKKASSPVSTASSTRGSVTAPLLWLPPHAEEKEKEKADSDSDSDSDASSSSSSSSSSPASPLKKALPHERIEFVPPYSVVTFEELREAVREVTAVVAPPAPATEQDPSRIGSPTTYGLTAKAEEEKEPESDKADA